MRAIVLTMLLTAASPSAVRAQWSFSLDPAQASEGQAVNLRVDDPSGCTPFGVPALVRGDASVTATFVVDDSVLPGGCPAAAVTPRIHSLGTFAPGSYEVDVVVCSNSPLPPPCTVRATLALSILGAQGTRIAIPTLSATAAIALGAVMLGAGLILRARG